MRYLDQADVLEAGERTIDTCPYTDAFASRELSGKRQTQFRGGHVVVTNKRILLISDKKIVLQFPLATFKWAALEPLDAVSRASIDLGRGANEPSDLTLWIFNFKRGEALQRVIAEQVSKAQAQRRKTSSKPSASRRSASKPPSSKSAARAPASPRTGSRDSTRVRPTRPSRPSESPAEKRERERLWKANWDNFIRTHRVGDIVEGRVFLLFARVTDSGANVTIAPGVVATLPGTPLFDQSGELLPGLPRLATGFKTSDGVLVHSGDTVRVRIVKIDPKADRSSGRLVVSLETRRGLFGRRS